MNPFKIDVPQATLDKIKERVRAFEWHEMPRGAQGDKSIEGSWAYGANLDFMKELCAYWVDGYDWRKAEMALNKFPQFIARAGNLDLHFYMEKGSGASPKPLILSHGWPGSVFEFQQLIEPLAHPERFGGDESDAFTVVVPSLPGYGWSGKPARPIGPRMTARLFDTLMTDVLKLPNYIAQGGDWGSSISGWMGYEGKGCRAVHLNMLGWTSPGAHAETEEEKQFAAKAAQLFEMEGAYFREQTTKPQTLSYGMMDSPVGTAAWIVEKFHAWSDSKGNIERRFTKDELLTNIMIYWVTQTINPSIRTYAEMARAAYGPTGPVPEKRVEVPTAVAVFPAEAQVPRAWADRKVNVQRFTQMPEGGHFAALEVPALYADDLRAFFYSAAASK